MVGDTVRCPWHHACFSLRTGEALRAPALDPIACWRVERRDGKIFVGEKREQAEAAARRPSGPKRPTGSSSSAAARPASPRPRCCGARAIGGSIVMLSDDDAPPVDRPNLSKDYLAGNAPEEWIPLRPRRASTPRTASTCGSRRDVAGDRPAAQRGRRSPTASTLAYDALLLATGAEPVRLPIPGADLPHVHTLRSLADSRAIIAARQDGASARS